MIIGTILKMSFVVFLCIGMTSVTNAQNIQTVDRPFEDLISTRNCEDWISWINKGLQEWQKDETASLIVAVKENSRRTNLQRLKTLKEYISGIESRNEIKVKAVLAEGERTKDLAVIEFYIKGKLLFSLQVLTKKDLPIRFCY